MIDFILNPEKKDNTVFATIIPVANKNGISKATGEARFLFNNREGNDVISPDPEGETNPDGGLDPDGDGANPDIDKPLDPDGGKDPDGQFDMKSLLWIIPTIVGSLLIICFIIFIIRTRKKSKLINKKKK